MTQANDAPAIRNALGKLVEAEGPHPTFDEMRAVALEMFEGRATLAQMGALLAALRLRGERLDDVVAFAEVMRDKATPLGVAPEVDTFDMCGTGGDRSGTFNISTAASFVVAAAGVKVAKHGNRAASSRCGSADVLEALGVDIAATPATMARCLEEIGICFMFAQSYHGAMKHVAPARRELGFRTIFNLLGPLTNPAGAPRQLIGVGSEQAFILYPEVLKRLGSRRVLVVRGEGGMDEITPYGTTRCSELRDGEVYEFELGPKNLGRQEFKPDDLRAGADAVENAAILTKVLNTKERGARREAVVWNAGAALYVAEKAESIAEGLELAERLIDDYRAIEKLEQFVNATRKA